MDEGNFFNSKSQIDKEATIVCLVLIVEACNISSFFLKWISSFEFEVVFQIW